MTANPRCGFSARLREQSAEAERMVAVRLIDALGEHFGGPDMPALRWSLRSGRIVGQAGADWADDEVPFVVARWRDALGLVDVSDQPGTVTARGMVDEHCVEIWGVSDHAAFNGEAAK